jgi:hypothetical protein
VPGVLARIRTARDIAFGTYFLTPGVVRDALAEAAHHGAHVEVTAQSVPFHDNGARKHMTAASAKLLRDAGAQVTLLDSRRTPFHLKAAVVDGVAYLDDRNWTQDGREIVLADDDPKDVALVEQALAGHGDANAALATRKDEALARELQVIASSEHAPVVLETETLGQTPLSAALRRHAKTAPTTLIVGRGMMRTPRQRALLEGLRRDGVDVRERGVNQKLALGGGVAWIGSANATVTLDETARAQVEWGLLTRDAALVGAVRTALERDAATVVRATRAVTRSAPASGRGRPDRGPDASSASPLGAACAARASGSLRSARAASRDWLCAPPGR